MPTLDLTIAPLEIKISRIAADAVTFLYTNPDGSPTDLTGYTGTFEVLDPNTGAVLANFSSKVAVSVPATLGIVTLGPLALADFTGAPLGVGFYLYHLLLKKAGATTVSLSTAGPFTVGDQ